MIETRFLWSEVIGVGKDYIDISKTLKVGESAPIVGDHIFQLGNKNNPSRQNAIVISTWDRSGSSFKMYEGINSFSLEGKETVVFSPGLNKLPGDTLIGGDRGAIGDVIDWIGGGELKMDIESSEGLLMVDSSFATVLTAKVFASMKNVTGDVLDWVWSRQSGTSQQAMDSDILWTYNMRNNKTNIVNITASDIPSNKTKFICDAVIDDEVIRGTT